MVGFCVQRAAFPTTPMNQHTMKVAALSPQRSAHAAFGSPASTTNRTPPPPRKRQSWNPCAPIERNGAGLVQLGAGARPKSRPIGTGKRNSLVYSRLPLLSGKGGIRTFADPKRTGVAYKPKPVLSGG